MSKTVGVALLLLVVVDCCGSAALPAGLHVAKRYIRKCRCRAVTGYGVMKCRYPLLPTNPSEERELIKCLCSIASHKFPNSSICTSWRPDSPLSLL